MAKAVFLDRDGTIVEDTGYLHEISKVRFLPRVSLAIKLLKGSGFKVIIITNQAGVARGYFTEETVREINEYVKESLAKESAFIDMVYYCPHHIDGIIEEYKKECYCRKPNPGMIEWAVMDFSIDLRSSFVIGNSISDIEAGRRAGCQTILLVDEASLSNKREIAPVPDRVVPDLYEAAKWLAKFSQQKEGSA